jgi:putative exporter of polyketide antibiotics
MSRANVTAPVVGPFLLQVQELPLSLLVTSPECAAGIAKNARSLSRRGLDIFGVAHHLDTVGGYAAYHAIGVGGIIAAVWGLLAGTRLLRGEEDTGRWELSESMTVAPARPRRRQ